MLVSARVPYGVEVWGMCQQWKKSNVIQTVFCKDLLDFFSCTGSGLAYFGVPEAHL
jgi:hypothetical protein